MALPIFIGEKMAKHILSCSFGKDSIATALLALQHGEPLDELVYCEVMFSEEISGELPEHNRFIHETAIPYFEQRGIPTRVLRSEKTYLSCFYHVVTRGKTKGMLSGFPLSGRCTIQRDCKLPPIKAFYKKRRCAIIAIRKKQLTVRFTEEEYAALKGKCEIAGMKMEPFVRSLVDGCRIKPAPPDSYNKLRQQLSAIGNNLNQLTHVANATGRVSASQLDRAQSLLEDMWRCVRDSL